MMQIISSLFKYVVTAPTTILPPAPPRPRSQPRIGNSILHNPDALCTVHALSLDLLHAHLLEVFIPLLNDLVVLVDDLLARQRRFLYFFLFGTELVLC